MGHNWSCFIVGVRYCKSNLLNFIGGSRVVLKTVLISSNVQQLRLRATGTGSKGKTNWKIPDHININTGHRPWLRPQYLHSGRGTRHCDLELQHWGIQWRKVGDKQTKKCHKETKKVSSWPKNNKSQKVLPRTRERCDQLASKGFKVIMPDYYHGEEAKICSGADFFCWMSQFFLRKSSSSSWFYIYRSEPFHSCKKQLD